MLRQSRQSVGSYCMSAGFRATRFMEPRKGNPVPVAWLHFRLAGTGFYDLRSSCFCRGRWICIWRTWHAAKRRSSCLRLYDAMLGSPRKPSGGVQYMKSGGDRPLIHGWPAVFSGLADREAIVSASQANTTTIWPKPTVRGFELSARISTGISGLPSFLLI